MSFFATLDRLRQKSPTRRKQVAFMTAASVTGMIALIWVISLPVRFQAPTVASDTTQATPSSFSRMGEAFKDQWASLKMALPTPEITPGATTSESVGLVLNPVVATSTSPSGSTIIITPARIESDAADSQRFVPWQIPESVSATSATSSPSLSPSGGSPL